MTRSMKTFLWAASLLCVTLAGTSSGQIIELQAESYSTVHNIANMVIGTFDTYVYGLDYPGEWTGYDLDVPAASLCSVQILARGDVDLTCRLEIVLTDAESDDEQISEISFLGDGVT